MTLKSLSELEEAAQAFSSSKCLYGTQGNCTITPIVTTAMKHYVERLLAAKREASNPKMTTQPEEAETPEGPARYSKVMTPEEAVATLVPEYSPSLWVGGMHMHNVPMALVRECIRQGRRFETFYAGPSSSIAAELLIGAGSVDRVVCAYIGFEHLGLAPVFRRVAESGSGTPSVVDADAGSLTMALQAGAWGQQFATLPRGIETTSLPASSPDFYRSVTDPFTGDSVFALQAIRPSVALIHCQQADDFGNGIFKGSHFEDHLLAIASERVIMQVEGLVDNSQVLKYPAQTVTNRQGLCLIPLSSFCDVGRMVEKDYTSAHFGVIPRFD